MFELLKKLSTDPAFTQRVKVETKTYLANTAIPTTHAGNKKIFLILKGKVKVSLSGTLKNKKPIHPGIVLGAEEVFGEFSLFEDLAENTEVVTLTPTKLLEIDIKSLRNFLKDNTEVGYTFLSDMFKAHVKRLLQADKTIVRLVVWGLKTHDIDKYL